MIVFPGVQYRALLILSQACSPVCNIISIRLNYLPLQYIQYRPVSLTAIVTYILVVCWCSQSSCKQQESMNLFVCQVVYMHFFYLLYYMYRCTSGFDRLPTILVLCIISLKLLPTRDVEHWQLNIIKSTVSYGLHWLIVLLSTKLVRSVYWIEKV